MALDVIIRNGMVVREAGVEALAIGIAGGKVVEVAPEIAGDAKVAIDAAGLHVFPGVIDAHVHFNDPGRAAWEGVATGSAALAAGGGTVFIDMPLNASPPTLDGDSFDAKGAACRGTARTDFALWGGLTPQNLDRLEELAERGVVGFKAFMANSGIDDFERCDDRTLFRGMEIAARLGLVVAVHAESEELTSRLCAEARASARSGVRDFLATRPIEAEVDAIRRAIGFARETGCALHIVHVSSAAGIKEVVESRGALNVSAETCPHYLMLSARDMEQMGAAAKCAPPLREPGEREALLRELLAGAIDTVGSDHSPAPAEMKRSKDFFDVWGGISGVQVTLRALITLGVPLPLIARLLAANVAARFKLPGKGGIAVGNDADLSLVDTGHAEMLTREELFDRHKLSPYIGREFRGRIRRTMLRGETVFLDGRLAGEPMGRLLKHAKA